MKRVIKPAILTGALLVFSVVPTTLSQKNEFPLLTTEGLGDVVVEARSALALDLLTDEIIFEKNIYEPLPLASLSKIISSLVVVDFLNLDEYVEVSKKAIETEEPSTLRVGEHLRVEDLLAMAMGESSNEAMMGLTEELGDEKWFVELMQEKPVQLGGRTAKFLNSTGLDLPPPLLIKEGKPSNFGSAYDLAQIVKNSLDSIIWQVGNKEEVIGKEGITHKIKHTNILRTKLAGIYGAKTGFTDFAGGNLILIIERPIGKPKLIVILGSTLEGRFEDAKKLVTLFK